MELIKSKVSGDLGKLFILMLTPRYDNWARLLDIEAVNKKQHLTIIRLIALMDH